MATISVMYPREPGGTFDYDYYRDVHIPLVQRLWGDAGLVSGQALKGISGGNGQDSPFYAIGLIHFASREALNDAIAGEHAAEVMGDIANFTKVKPIVQINEELASID
jgi:uncharacterized protein (TIGR02118 family)